MMIHEDDRRVCCGLFLRPYAHRRNKHGPNIFWTKTY
ncbi:hypothetical protein DFP93_11144 [Aneurinibacillus soli]|uniref:Uncharacterized protein n=1 Tax=Aneurinibacillus soli TaxID=1500254 RepID=A0A0U5ASH9_9BACL|nr:hypothetical protein DFP93_11144 [Aneurinibacillus soli]BAU26773.1 hypothetical protein CB4_00941 [Aneurinibacillus soli]